MRLHAREQSEFLGIEELPYAFRESDSYRLLYQPLGIVHQVRLLVLDGDRFAGWIGLLRRDGRPDFGEVERRRLRGAVPGIRAAMKHVDRKLRGALGDERAAAILDPEGQIEQASPRVHAFLSPDGRAHLARAVRELGAGSGADEVVICGLRVRLAPVRGGETSRYVAMFESLPGVRIGRLSGLSPRLLQTGARIARGEDIATVARELGLREDTVRGYLKMIYRRLGVRSRLELAMLFRNELPGSDAEPE
ncbi:MAG: LuxR C-terminal-related transcriptional regulator [Myxococcales bacterium]|nr:LuxR C-terminal-related transcriptional regulator [Myxococcales bacterium]